MAGIFKAYDIRGVYGESLDKEMGYKIGLGFATLIGAGKSIVCGRDERTHSPELQAAFIRGAMEGGLNVTNMGPCTTPMSYFACATGGYDGSTMITASHNPGKYNGLKFCREQAIPMGYAEGIDRIEALIEAGDLVKAENAGSLSEKDYRQAYLDFLVGHVKLSRKYHFAVDCGNGMGGFLIGDFLAQIEQSAEPLYWDLDFTFPNHLANPLDFGTLRALQAMIREKNLEFGVAFDGDADRCFFVDDKGEVIPADLLTALLAVDYLRKSGPSAIIYDVRSSKVVAERIREEAGTPVLCRVGHSFMKAKLRELNGVFGGELAGHFYFRDFFFADSAFYTMIRVLDILEASGKKLSELIDPFRKYAPSGEINFKTDLGDFFIEEAPKRYPGGEVLTIDGIRIDFADWWFCLRKSNTEPLLRLVIEADNQALMQAKVADIQGWLLENGATIEAGH